MCKGAFISFEGVDGIGKTTHIKTLEKDLNADGYKTLLTFEPGGSAIGPDIREIILGDKHSVLPMTETLLLCADRYEHQQTVVIPALEKGKIVLSDRAQDSTVAYQSYGKRVDLDFIDNFNDKYLIFPKLTCWLTADAADITDRVALRKKNGDVNKFDMYREDFFKRVADGYEALFKKHPERIKKIRADGNLETVYKLIKNTVYAFLGHHRF